MGGGAVLHQALRLFGRARAMLDESDYTEKTGRDLLAVTSELGIEAGWAACDHGEHELARRALWRGATAGHQQRRYRTAGPRDDVHGGAGDVLGRSVRRWYGHGLSPRGPAVGRMAGAVARHEPSPRLHAAVALRQAAAYAALGDASAFRAAIGRARRELDRGAHPCDAPWTASRQPRRRGRGRRVHRLPAPG